MFFFDEQLGWFACEYKRDEKNKKITTQYIHPKRKADASELIIVFMYYLYLDESGDLGDHLQSPGVSRYFVIAVKEKVAFE
jgi:hypothetical protein